MSAPCPVCSGVGHSMGVLGTLEHFRCESCGWEFSDAYREGEFDFGWSDDEPADLHEYRT